MKNIRHWKTTIIGLISYIISFFYLFKVENHNVWIFIVLIIFSTMMLFSADTLLDALGKFIKNNQNKKI